MDRPHATKILGSQRDDEADSEAITVRTPDLPPVVEDEAPFPLVRPARSNPPMSLRSPASKEPESAWFEKEPPLFVAPGVAEVAEPIGSTLDVRQGFAPSRSRAIGFLAVAVGLAGIVAAGSFFFLSARAIADRPATTQLTNGEAPVPVVPAAPPVTAPAPAPMPEATPAATTTPAVKTVRTTDLPDSRRVVPRKVTTPATDPGLHPDDSTTNGMENTIPTPSPDSTTTPPDLEEKK